MKSLLLEVNRENWSKTKGYRLGTAPTPTLDEKKDPRDADRVILEPLFGGICGTDKGIWFRKAFRESILHHLELDKKDYRIAGHEMLGRIVAMGSRTAAAKKFSVGQIVTAESHVYCGECAMCLQGDQHVCVNERIIGVTWDGVFAEQVKLPANVLWATDLQKIRPEVAAVQEPFGNAVHVCTPSFGNTDLRSAEMRGRTVAIFGCGTIGLFSILIARALGAKKIIGIEPNADNQKRALACGADKVISPSDHSGAEVRDFCDGLGADYCLEMSGFASSVLQALQGSRRGGNIVLFGLSAGDLTLPAFEEFITAGKRIHAVVGRRVFSTWELTQQLLEDRQNGIQDKIWEVLLNKGHGTILPMAEFTPERFESAMLAHPKTLLQIHKI